MLAPLDSSSPHRWSSSAAEVRMYAPEIPERISSAVGRRGQVPVLAKLNSSVEIQASLVPMGGGKHRLQLNTRTCSELTSHPVIPCASGCCCPQRRPISGCPLIQVKPWGSRSAGLVRQPYSGKAKSHHLGDRGICTRADSRETFSDGHRDRVSRTRARLRSGQAQPINSPQLAIHLIPVGN